MNWNDWNLSKDDFVYLMILLFISSFSIFKMIDFCWSACISNPDIAVYLLSGLKYAGLDYYNVAYPSELFHTPILSFLSSLFFRLDYVDKNAIILVVSFINFLGFFGLYVLFKNRFNPLLSLIGVVIYGSLPVIIVNTTRGMIDLAAISITFWILVFAIMSIEKNPKYFLITFPLFVIGFFTKYLVGFALPLIVLYYAMDKDIISKLDLLLSDKAVFNQKLKNYLKSIEFKYIVISLIISIILFLIISKTLILDFGGSLTFFEQSVKTFNGTQTPSNIIDFNIDKSYYMDHFTDILFLAGYHSNIFMDILYGIFIVGLGIRVVSFIRNFNQFNSDKKSFKTKNLYKILLFSSVILILVVFIIFKEIPNHMAINVLWCIIILIFFSLLDKCVSNKKFLSVDLLFLAYFLLFFTFMSLYTVKVPRYSLFFIPPFIYFVIWGLNAIVGFLDGKKLFEFNIKNVVPIVILVIFLLLTVSVVNNPMDYDESKKMYRDVFAHDFENDYMEVCDFIKEYDGNYHDKTFASFYHHSRIMRWYLNVDPLILDEDSSLKNFNQTDYVVLNLDKKLDNYDLIYKKGGFNVYSLK